MAHSPDICSDPGKFRPVAPKYLDLECIRQWLARDVEWPHDTCLRQVRVNRLWVGPPGRIWFELALELICSGTPVTYMLQGGFGATSRPKRRHHRAELSPHGLGGLLLSRDHLGAWLGAWCCTPDRDRKLRVVRDLLDCRPLARLLRETAAASVLGLDRRDAGVQSKIAAYRARKRCVLRARSTDDPEVRSVFLKVFRYPPTQEQIETLRRVGAYLHARSDGRICLPAIIDFLPEQRLLITAAVKEPTGRLRTAPEDLSAAAAALALLHDGNVRVARVHTAGNEFELVCRRVHGLQLVGNQQPPQLRELLTELARLVRTIQDPYSTLIHGAFHSAQMLRSNNRLWLMDFDTLCYGHAEVDVSKFVARLFLNVAAAGGSPQEATELAGRFVDRYRSKGGVIADRRMRFYLPCAMVRHGATRLARGLPTGVVEPYWQLAKEYAEGTWSL